MSEEGTTDINSEWRVKRGMEISAMTEAMLDALEGGYEEAKLLQEAALAAPDPETTDE